MTVNRAMSGVVVCTLRMEMNGAMRTHSMCSSWQCPTSHGGVQLHVEKVIQDTMQTADSSKN